MSTELFKTIRIGLASPSDIRKWSYGEVTKPETINYRTLKPEKAGLFCERVFGPVKDYECACGKLKKVRHRGLVCDVCGVECTRAKVRRERMAHIELAAPVSHIWYFKGVPSRMGLLLDMTIKELEKVLYYLSYIVVRLNRDRITDMTPKFRAAISNELMSYENLLNREVDNGRKEDLKKLKEELREKILMLGDYNSKVVKNVYLADDIMDPKTGELLAGLFSDLDKAAIDLLKGRKIDAEDIPVVMKEEFITKALLDIDYKAEERRKETSTKVKEREKELDDACKDLIGLAHKQIMSDEEFERLNAFLHVLKENLHGNFDDLVEIGMGAEAIKKLLAGLDLDSLFTEVNDELSITKTQKRLKLIKRIKVIESFRQSGNRPEWMILDVVPVLPPDLRPMVQLDGGRFASSDLNDLYRRVINRNNRLKKLIEIRAPESIIRNEKRMLQEAVDSLIDNGRRGRAVTSGNGRPLRSLAHLLKGKQGRFRQNLLGKRVDYSGRSVIVVGPSLKLYQCGLPKEMAKELFKPFIINRLVARDNTNIKIAKGILDNNQEEAMEVLEEVVKDHPVLLNRAPTLHRLGIQAFEPVLVDGKAIKLHPLVCAAFNADFDGDQMAVHVPLTMNAQAEARLLMLASNNLLLPADGSPIVTPSQDIVIGIYYMTNQRDGAVGEGRVASSVEEALKMYDFGLVNLHALIWVKLDGEMVETTVGRLMFNQVLPPIGYVNKLVDKREMSKIVLTCFKEFGPTRTVQVLDDLKDLGYAMATRSGLTISIEDIVTSPIKPKLLNTADDEVEKITKEFMETADKRMPQLEKEIEKLRASGEGSAKKRGQERKLEKLQLEYQSFQDVRRMKRTEFNHLRDKLEVNGMPYPYLEYYDKFKAIWEKCSKDVMDDALRYFDPFNSVLMMVQSGGRGSIRQIKQMAGMRGLMINPEGWATRLPVKSNFKEGLSVLEYFISTHGARKGLADTALRTAESGYLTRRLVDVAQDLFTTAVTEGADYTDCGTTTGIKVNYVMTVDGQADILDLATGGTRPLSRNESEALHRKIFSRYPLKDIHAPDGELICSKNEIISDEMIDEIAKKGTKKVIEFRSSLECRNDFGVCIKCYGMNLATRHIVVLGEPIGIIAAQSIGEPGTQLTMRTFHTGGTAGQDITQGLPRVEELFEARKPKEVAKIARESGSVEVREDEGKRVVSIMPGKGGETKEYDIPFGNHLLVKDGDKVKAGDPLTRGPIDPHDILAIKGRREVQEYLVREIQGVYASQGVSTHDKHIEVIVKQMLRKSQVKESGESTYVKRELIDTALVEKENDRLRAESKQEIEATPVLLGITKASLSTDSFLAAASFQETTRVLTEAAINGKVDVLRGLKENVIIGSLIPVGTGLEDYRNVKLVSEQPVGIEG